MYKEIIIKFQGLNVRDIFNDIINIHPQLLERFKKFDQFSDLGGRTRGHLMEFAVYHFMNQGAMFNVMQKGADFIDTDGKFDLKCITLKENNISLSGDTPIGAFDGKPYSSSNIIKKLHNLVIPIIDRNLEIVDIREFKSKEIEDELKEDWKIIINHILSNKKGNCNGSHCKYLRAKNRGSKYYIMFTQNRILNLIRMSHSIAENKIPIKNKNKYIREVRKQFMNVASYGEFMTDYENIGLKGLYDKYVLKNLEL